MSTNDPKKYGFPKQHLPEGILFANEEFFLTSYDSDIDQRPSRIRDPKLSTKKSLRLRVELLEDLLVEVAQQIGCLNDRSPLDKNQAQSISKMPEVQPFLLQALQECPIEIIES